LRSGTVPPAGLNTINLHDDGSVGLDHHVMFDHSVLPTSLQQLALDQQCGTGPVVGHHKLPDHRVSLALGDTQLRGKSHHQPIRTRRASPDRKHCQRPYLGAAADMQFWR
jgi:hypothetical protein